MTKTSLLFTLLFSLTTYSYSQIGLGDTMVNSADRLILSDSRITLGGYGEIDFNNPLRTSNGDKRNGSFDVHRMVFLTG